MAPIFNPFNIIKSDQVTVISKYNRDSVIPYKNSWVEEMDKYLNPSIVCKVNLISDSGCNIEPIGKGSFNVLKGYAFPLECLCPTDIRYRYEKMEANILILDDSALYKDELLDYLARLTYEFNKLVQHFIDSEKESFVDNWDL